MVRHSLVYRDKREVKALSDLTLLHPKVKQVVAVLPTAVEVLSCEGELADTEVFCRHYGYSLDDSANTLLVKGKRGGTVLFVACVVLASTRLDVNQVVRKRMGVRRLSFADAQEAEQLTGMEMGGVTPPGLPGDMPLWVDDKVMEREFVVLGGGNRRSKLKAPPSLLLGLPGVEVVPGMASFRQEQP